MAIAGNGGHCCECNQLSGCDCEYTVACALACRTKGGDATLIGFPEYCDPSDPPKRYRQRDFFGNNPLQGYGPAMCTGGPTGTANPRQSGSMIYDALTGVLTDTSSFADGAAPLTPITGACVNSSGCESNATISQTDYSITGNDACCNVGGEWRKAQGVRGESLSEEDTEADAEARIKAGITDWTPCADCLTTCSAFRTDRAGTSDVVFGFRNVQTKCSWTAIIGGTYNVRINFARRVLGTSGPYLDLGMPFESIVSADVTSESTDWVDLPTEAGWETIASGCVVTFVP